MEMDCKLASKLLGLLSTEHSKQLITAEQLFSICDSKSCSDFLSSANNQTEWINLDQSKAMGIPSNKKAVLRVMKQQKLRSCEESGCRGHASSTLPDAFWTSSLSPQISVMWGASTAKPDVIRHNYQFKLWYACPRKSKITACPFISDLSKTSCTAVLQCGCDSNLIGIWSWWLKLPNSSQVPCKRPVVSPRIYVSTEVPIGPPGPDSKTNLRSENAKIKQTLQEYWEWVHEQIWKGSTELDQRFVQSLFIRDLWVLAFDLQQLSGLVLFLQTLQYATKLGNLMILKVSQTADCICTRTLTQDTLKHCKTLYRLTLSSIPSLVWGGIQLLHSSPQQPGSATSANCQRVRRHSKGI